MHQLIILAIALSVCPEIAETGEPQPGKLVPGLPFCDRCDHSGKIRCPSCQGKGKLLKACPKCEGTGQRPCSRCRGSSVYRCETCEGLGFREKESNIIHPGGVLEKRINRIICTGCRGKRLVSCIACSGDGKIVCPKTVLDKVCPECRFVGRVPCPDCHGRLRAMVDRHRRAFLFLADWTRTVIAVVIFDLFPPERAHRLSDFPSGEPNGIDR